MSLDPSSKKPTSTGRAVLGGVLVLIVLCGLNFYLTINDNFRWTFVLGVFALFVLVYLYSGGRKWYTELRVGVPEILVSETTAVLGQEITVQYNNTFRQATDFDKLHIKLLFKESATYQQGTNTRTVTHENVVAEHELPGGHYPKGSFMSESVTFTIPLDGMHTVEVRRNSLRWLIKIEMALPRLADYTREIEVKVSPDFIKSGGF